MAEESVKYITYFDVECANSLNHSICQIGLICDDGESGETVYSKRIYVNPEDKFEPYTTRVHGLKEENVAGKPDFSEVWAEIGQYFEDAIVVGHGLCGCDFIALHKQLLRYGLPLPKLKYVDTYDIACDILLPTEKKNLHDLTVKYNLPDFKAHDAYNDALATKNLLDEFVNVEGVDAEKYIKFYEYVDHGYVFRRYAPQRGSGRDVKAMRELVYILREIPLSGEIDGNLSYRINGWLNEYGGARRKSPYNKLTVIMEKILFSGVQRSEQTDRILQLIVKTVDPVFVLKSKLKDIRGRRVYLMGNFCHGESGAIASEVVKRGGKPSETPSKISVILAGSLGGSDIEILKLYLSAYKSRKKAAILTEDDFYCIRPVGE